MMDMATGNGDSDLLEHLKAAEANQKLLAAIPSGHVILAAVFAPLKLGSGAARINCQDLAVIEMKDLDKPTISFIEATVDAWAAQVKAARARSQIVGLS